MSRKITLEQRVAKRIARQKSPVVLREDLADLGGYDQVGRALRNLTAQGLILKIGYGLYARTKPSSRAPGERIPEQPLVPYLAREALARLGVEVAPTRLESLYLQGKHNQVLTGRVIGVRSRIRRKIGYNRMYVQYERVAKQNHA